MLDSCFDGYVDVGFFLAVRVRFRRAVRLASRSFGLSLSGEAF